MLILIQRFLVLATAFAISGCGTTRGPERIWASERQECQEAIPVQQAECLEQARKGHVLRRDPRFRWPRQF